MAIYSRRILQHLINENAEVLSRKQIKKHVFELNRMHQTLSLAFEWEVVLLNAFSKVGKIAHERNFGGTREPDLYFESTSDPNQRFAADITTLSDKGLEGNNPYETLFDELMKTVRERGLRPDSFSLDVEGNHGELYRDGPRARLKLPPPSRFKQVIFNADFDRFMEEVSLAPETPKQLRIHKAEDNIDLTIGYDPSQWASRGGHLVYKRINHLTDNIVYTRLREKRDQIIDSRFDGPRAIILCDGGFDAFFSSAHHSTYSVEAVIKHFIMEHNDIDFILTFGIKDSSFSSQPRNQMRIGRYAKGFFHDGHMELLNCIDKLPDHLPQAESNARNGINWLKGNNPHYGRSHWGGMRWGQGRRHMKVKISARALLELLAGKVTQQEFFERYGFVPSELRPFPPHVNPFASGVKAELTIGDVTFEKSETEDDDWVEFTLHAGDPAVSEFFVPKI
jgi:hypothetical protein